MNFSKTIRIIMVVSVIAVSCIPVFHIAKLAGDSWKGIVPEYIEDSSYYYARVQDVVKGNLFIGSPYFIEHRNEIPPAFFVSDWVASIPFLVGIPFVPSVITNIVVWSLVFVWLLFILFKSFGLKEYLAALFSVVTYLQVFWLFVRPVAMQIIFPAYIFFILSLFLWMREPEKKKYRWFVVLGTLSCVYSYTYLMQIAAITIIVISIYFIVTKKWNILKNFASIMGLVVIGCIPFIIVSLTQISHPLYFETLTRIGLLFTHIPRMEIWYYGRWVVIAVCLWWYTRRISSSFKQHEGKSVFVFILLLSSGLIIASGSNIFTGNELEIANHVGRFSIVWFSIVLCTYLAIALKSYKGLLRETKLWQKIIVSLLILVCGMGVVRNFPRAFPFFRVHSDNVVSVQRYADALAWLKNSVATSSVVWADDSFSTYIPIMTQHYVLFHPSGALQIVSDRELEDRYILSRSLSSLKREAIETDVRLYGGAGKAFGLPKDSYEKIWARYVSVVANPKDFIARFHVEYYVQDLEVVPQQVLSKKIKYTEVYRDRSIVIYRIQPLP